MLIGPLWGEVRLFRDVLRLKGTNNKILQNSKLEPKKFTFSCTFKGTVSRHGFPVFWKQFTDRIYTEGGVFLTFLEASPSAVLNNKKQENFDDNFKNCRYPFIGLAKRPNLSRGTVPLMLFILYFAVMNDLLSSLIRSIRWNGMLHTSMKSDPHTF